MLQSHVPLRLGFLITDKIQSNKKMKRRVEIGQVFRDLNRNNLIKEWSSASFVDDEEF
jgi:hypothetical protein